MRKHSSLSMKSFFARGKRARIFREKLATRTRRGLILINFFLSLSLFERKKGGRGKRKNERTKGEKDSPVGRIESSFERE